MKTYPNTPAGFDAAQRDWDRRNSDPPSYWEDKEEGTMPIKCTRCDGTGFLNLFRIPENEMFYLDSVEAIGGWIANHDDHDVQVCDCCGNGEEWHGIPGEHYSPNDPVGKRGPYAYNGGLCECH